MKRKLAAVETLMWLGAHKTPTNFVAVAHLEGTFSTPQLHEALDLLRIKHPLLAVRIVLDYRHLPWFSASNVAQFSVRDLPRRDDQSWIKEAETELRTFFPTEGPLVRFVILRGETSTDFIITCHHAVADGMSGVYLLRDLLQVMEQPHFPIEPLPLLPSLDDMIGLAEHKELADFKLTTQTRATITNTSLPPHKMEITAPPKPVLPNFSISAWAWSAEQTAALIACAQAAGVSVHSAITTAFLRGFIDFRGDTTQFFRRFSSAVSLRQRLPKPIGEDFGMFVTPQLVVAADCSPERPFWEIARDIYADFQRESTFEKLIAPHFALRQVVTTIADEARPENDFDYDVSYDFGISNLGRLNIPTQYGELTLKSLYVPLVNGYGDEKIIGVCTLGGQLYFNMIVRADVMPLPEVERARDLAMGHLAGALD